MIEFDYTGALEEGSPEEIAQFLSDEVGFDYASAVKDGASPDEIIDYFYSDGLVQAPSDKEPEVPEEPEGNGILNALGSGLKQMAGSVNTTRNVYLGNDEAAKASAEKLSAEQVTPSQQEFQLDLQKNFSDNDPNAGTMSQIFESTKDFVSAAASNPKGALHMMVSQVPNMAPTMAGMWAGAKAGGLISAPIPLPGARVIGATAGAIVGMFLGNTAIETGYIAAEDAAKGQYDRDAIIKKGLGKAAGVTAWDTLAMGTTKLLFGPSARAMHKASQGAIAKALEKEGLGALDDVALEAALKSNPGLRKRIFDVGKKAAKDAAPTGLVNAALHGTSFGVETVSEGAGEYTGQVWGGMDPSISEAVTESMSALGTSAVGVGIGKSFAKIPTVIKAATIQDISNAETVDDATKAFTETVDQDLNQAAQDLNQAAQDQTMQDLNQAAQDQTMQDLNQVVPGSVEDITAGIDAAATDIPGPADTAEGPLVKVKYLHDKTGEEVEAEVPADGVLLEIDTQDTALDKIIKCMGGTKTLEGCLKIHGAELNSGYKNEIIKIASQNKNDGYEANHAERLAVASVIDILDQERKDILTQLPEGYTPASVQPQKNNAPSASEALAPSSAPQGATPSPYFNDTPGARTMNLSDIRPRNPIITEEGKAKLIRGREKMTAAKEGKGEKRNPITVYKQDDGGYIVLDGNTTYHILQEMGEKSINVNVVPDIRQDTDDLNEIYKKAEASRGEIKTLTETAAKDLGGTAHFRKDNELKDINRAKEKVKAYGTAARLKDIIASTVSFKTEKELRKGLDSFRKTHGVVDVKDRFASPMASGYRDVSMTIRLDNGHLAEVQFTTDGMLNAKMAAGHKIYELMREVKSLNRPGVNEIVESLNALSKKYYDAAFSDPASSSALSSEMGIDVMRISKAIGEGSISTLLDPSILKSFSDLASQTKGTPSESKNVSDIKSPPKKVEVSSDKNIAPDEQKVNVEKTKPEKLTVPKVREALGKVITKKAMAALEKSGRLDIVKTEKELVDIINSVDKDNLLQSADGTIEGLYDPRTGKVHMVAENIRTEQQAWDVLRHELGVHAGLRGMLGKRFKEILVQVDYRVKRGDKALLKAREKAIDAGTVPEDLIEETLAYFISDNTNKDHSLYKKIVTAIRAWAFKNGVKLKLTNDDIIALVNAAIKREVATAKMTRGKGTLKFQKQSTRVPSAGKATEDALEQLLTIRYDEALRDKIAVLKNVKALVKEVSIPAPKGKVHIKADTLVNAMADNLLWFHDLMPEKLRKRAKLWYKGANHVAKSVWAKRYGTTAMQNAAVIAVNSPGTEWFQNMSRAERILDIVHYKRDFKWTPEMTRTSVRLIETAKKNRNEKFEKAMATGKKINRIDPWMRRAKGRTLGQVLSDPLVAAHWIRVYDETHNNRAFNILTPEGGSGKTAVSEKTDKPRTTTWGTYGEIAKSVSIITDGSFENIHYLLSDTHKVRNFYNNIYAPDSDLGFVTVDTHAVGAALFKPLGLSSVEVGRAFGSKGGTSQVTGLKGTYPYYVEAHWRAANKRNILPREMQSISWESKRAVFGTEDFKAGSKKYKAVNAILQQVKKGLKTMEAARSKILDIAGGFKDPEWADAPYNENFVSTYDRSGYKDAPKKITQKAREPMVTFEVAPHPKNVTLVNRWNNQSPEAQHEISTAVASRIIPKILKEFSTNGTFIFQVGGYEGAANTSFGLDLSSPQSATQIAKMIGYALSQESMVVVSSRPVLGTEETGVITIDLPDGWGVDKINDLYYNLDKLKYKGEKLVSGHTTVNGKMSILNFTGIDNDVVAKEIHDYLNGEFSVRGDKVHSAFIDEKEYGYGTDTKSRNPAGRSVLRHPRNFRNEASKALEEELSKREEGLKYSRRSGINRSESEKGNQRVRGEGDQRRSAPAVDEQGTVELTHWGRTEGLQELDPSYHGEGYRGAESKRKEADPDTWIDRTYYGVSVNEGGGYTKEPGLGSHQYTTRIPLKQLYDYNSDPDGIQEKAIAAVASASYPYINGVNVYEKLIKEAGYKGYWSKMPGSGGLVAAVFDKLPVKSTTPRILFSKNPESKEFKTWSKGRKVLEGEQIAKTGDTKGIVARVYHGTTHLIDAFDPKKQGTPEGKFGRVNYFTSSEQDADDHYRGVGPDLERRIGDLAERFSSMEVEDFENWLNQNGFDPDMADAAKDSYTALEQIAEEYLVGPEDTTMDLYVRLDNPAYLNGVNANQWIDLSNLFGAIVSALQDIPNDRMEISEKTAEKIQKEIDTGDMEMSLTELYERLEASETLVYLESESGEMIGNHVIGQVFKNLGYDGIVLQNVETIFTGMNLEDNTSHIHIFEETPGQIKSATENVGTWNEEDARIKFSKVTDKKLIDKLESGEKVKVYRAMQLIDGKLYPPMSAKVNGEMREPTKIGQWERAEENPDIAKKGMFKLDKANKSAIQARYNPYFHTSASPLNDQFSSAYKRSNLVTVEAEIPKSELTDGYQAKGAKDSVGEKPWHAGPVSSKLPAGKKRTVILSRYAKVTRIVPDGEIAKKVSDLLNGSDISIPDNVVTPSLRKELMKRGVTISNSRYTDSIKFSKAPAFYSALEKGIEELKQKKAPAQQWLGMINKLPGLKKEELEWMGLEDWLKDQKGAVNKSDILDFVAANRVEIKEVVKGDIDEGEVEAWWTDEGGANEEKPYSELSVREQADAIMRYQDESGYYKEDATKFSDYQLPGGKNYKEMLLTLPGKKTEFPLSIEENNNGYFHLATPDGKRFGNSYESIEEAQELLDFYKDNPDRLPPAHRGKNVSEQYKSSHWDEPNVVAHIRMSEREVDGKRVLHVEEIQSDLHQEGRKKGYKDQAYIAELKREKKEIEDSYSNKETWTTRDELRWSDITNAIRELGNSDKVPDAPFKKSWPMLAMKKMIRYAAENGFDTVAWSTGDQQFDRWGSELFAWKKIRNKNSGLPGWKVIGKEQTGGNAFEGMDAELANEALYKGKWIKDKKDLADIIEYTMSRQQGEWSAENWKAHIKKLTDSIWDRMQTEDEGSTLPRKEGMKGFYDKILPAEVKKFFGKKAWGNARVGEIEVGVNKEEAISGHDVMMDLGIPSAEQSDYWRNLEQDERDQLMKAYRNKGVKFHALEITPQMKDKALTEGMPLFSKKTNSDTATLEKEDTAPVQEEENYSAPASRPFDLKDKSTLIDTLKYNIWNTLDPVSKIYKALGKKVSEAEDYMAKEMLRISRAKADIDRGTKRFVKPIVDLMTNAGLPLDMVDEFLYARHAREANARLRLTNARYQLKQLHKIRKGSKIEEKLKTLDRMFKEGNLPTETMQKRYLDFLETELNAPKTEAEKAFKKKWDEFKEKPSGMTDTEADEIMERLAINDDLQEIGKLFDRMNAENLRRSYISGRMTKEEYQGVKGTFEHYAPLMREGYEDTMSTAGIGTGVTGMGKDVRARGGSTKRAVHILANAVLNYQKGAIKARKSDTARAFFNLVKNNPNEDFWGFEKPKTRVAYDAAGNLKREAARSLKSNEVEIKVDGKVHIIWVNPKNDHAMRMLKGIRGEQVRGIAALAKFNRILATINTTLNPEFVISNFFRDAQTAFINLTDTEIKDMKFKVMKALPKALAGLIDQYRGDGRSEWAKIAQRYENSGARIGWIDYDENVLSRVKKIEGEININRPGMTPKKAIVKTLRFIEDWNMVVENAVRLATFKTAIDAGVSEEKAALMAKDLTVNFNQKGALGQVINSLYLFANAGIQGSAKTFSVLKNSKSARRMVTAGIFAAVGMAAANRGIGGDDDDGVPYYDKVDDYVKERNIIFMIPDGGGKYAKIPLPWGYNVFWALGTEIGELITRPDYDVEKGMVRMVFTAANAFNPLQSATLAQTLSPTVMDPIVQSGENKSWSGSPLMPDINPFATVQKPDSERYWASARKPSVEIAKGLNRLTGGNVVRKGKIDISPETLDMVWDTFTGGTGRFVADTIQAPIKLLTDQELPLRRIPVARKLLGSTSEHMDAATFRENIEKVYTLEEEMDAYPEMAKDIKQNKLYPLIRDAKSIEKRLRMLGKMLKKVQTKEGKKKLESKILKIKQDFNNKVREAA